MRDRRTQTMAAIAATVGVAAALAPRATLRLFGVPARDVTGATAFSLRLFAGRNIYLAARALQGDQSAVRAFLPLQVLDQAVFWHAFATRAIPRPGAALAAGVSLIIIVVDRRRRLDLATQSRNDRVGAPGPR